MEWEIDCSWYKKDIQIEFIFLVETNLSSDKQIAVFFKKQLFSHDLEWN
jgi:hypothetical protein